MTLQEGLIEFQEKNGKYFSKDSYSSEGEAFLNCHDIAHVVFGCDTSIYGEGIVKIWTTFGTSLNFGEVTRGYYEAKAFKLSREYSLKHVFKNIFKLLMTIPKAIYRAKKMKKSWPFKEYKKYLNTPIDQIRMEFNIQVIS